MIAIRQRGRSLIYLAAMLSLLVPTARAQSQSVHEQFDAVRTELLGTYRRGDIAERAATMEACTQYPVAEAVRLVLEGFDDSEPRVRAAAYLALHKMNDSQEVCDTLLNVARAQLKQARKRRGKDSAGDQAHARGALPAIAALLTSPLPLSQARVQHLLDQELANATHGAAVLVDLADELGWHGEAMNAPTLTRLCRTRLFQEHFGVRRATIQALTRLPNEVAIDPLIAVLGSVRGEAKADAARHLTQVTGQKWGFNATAWMRWRQATAPPEVLVPRQTAAQWTVTVARADELEAPRGEYYGMQLFAERLVFVFDVSGSMQGGRILAAKRELMAAIDSLPSQSSFGIVVFNGQVHRWHRDLVPADARHKKAALAYVERQNPTGNTATSDALDAAFTYDTEAIYFLTDGAPTAGKILAPVDILAAVAKENHVRRISFYTIGIAPGFTGSPTDEFLSRLAEQNFGEYRRVDH